MISLSDLYLLVSKNILEKKKRTFLTVSGIIIGIFTFTFFIFVSQGLSNAITEQFSSLGVNVLVIEPANSGGRGPSSSSSTLTRTDMNKIKQVVRGYDYITGQIFHSAQYEFSREKSVLTTVAFENENLEKVQEELKTEALMGRPLKASDTGVVYLGYKVANEGFNDKKVTVGTSLKVEGKSFRVIGIGKEKGDLFLDNSIIMNIDDVRDLAELENDEFKVIRVSLLEGTDADLMQQKIETKLNPNNNEKRVSVTSPKQAIEQFDQILGVLNLIIGFVSSIALFVGGINVMNTMYSNISERINEISVMKALGATAKDIRNIFLVESSALGIFGAFIGFLLSFGLAKILGIVLTNMGYNVPIYFELSFFIQVIIVTALFTMLFGTYPALKAAAINPADNLRDE
jgi:putative ABC transport system permease protein